MAVNSHFKSSPSWTDVWVTWRSICNIYFTSLAAHRPVLFFPVRNRLVLKYVPPCEIVPESLGSPRLTIILNMETHKSDDNAICRRQVPRFTCRIDSLVCENSLLNLTLPPFLLSTRLSKSIVYLISVDVTGFFPVLDISVFSYIC